jgi:hypothetical protein
MYRAFCTARAAPAVLHGYPAAFAQRYRVPLLSRPDVPELLNRQPAGSQAKPYQVAQLLKLVEQYWLRLEDEE